MPRKNLKSAEEKVVRLINFSFLRSRDNDFIIQNFIIFLNIRKEARFAPLIEKVDAAEKQNHELLRQLAFQVLGDVQQTEAKNTTRYGLEGEMRGIGDGVESIADGDRGLVWASGFPLIKDAKKVPPVLVPPSQLAAVNTIKSGEIEATWQRISAFKLAMVQVRKRGTENWGDPNSGKDGKCRIDGLAVGEVYEVRAAFIDNNGKRGDFCKEILVLVS